MISTTRTSSLGLALLACALVLPSCQRERRTFRPAPPAAEMVEWTRFSDLDAGSSRPLPLPTSLPTPVVTGRDGYEESAYAVSEGKRLYTAFNCVGCHAHGGGATGPALMDHVWFYVHEPEQIFATIVEGRPNGMPSFGGRIPAYQVWQLVAYVRDMGGLGNKGAAPGRDDHMKVGTPEHSRKSETPEDSWRCATPRRAPQ